MQKHTHRLLVCLLTMGTLASIQLSEAGTSYAQTLPTCTYVQVWAGTGQDCLSPVPPIHRTGVTQICDGANGPDALFQDDGTQVITPILSGNCVSFNSQSGTITTP